MTDFDACVVGGGPAGLTVAIALRLAAQSVFVLDANVPPIDKACGEGLMPDTLHAFAELGIRLTTSEGAPFRGVRFVRGGQSIAADFPAAPALGLRRTVLHSLLLQRAIALGVELLWGAKGVRLTTEGVACDGAAYSATLVVGADGQNSAVRRFSGLGETVSEKRRYGFRRHYAVPPWSPYMEVHWGKRCQLYITPVSTDEIGVAVLTGDPKQRLDDALQLFPDVAARLRQAPPTSPIMGAVVATRELKRVCSDRIALIGDASGSVDAITGEGIGLAARQAIALAKAVSAGDLKQYQREHRKIQRRPVAMANLLLFLARFEGLQRRSVTALAEHPDLFAKLLAVHVGEGSFVSLCDRRLLDAGLSFLTA